MHRMPFRRANLYGVVNRLQRDLELQNDTVRTLQNIRRGIHVRRPQFVIGSFDNDDPVLPGWIDEDRRHSARDPGDLSHVSSIDPNSSKFLIVDGPNRSSPTRATMKTSAPHSRAATAWLAPFPPNPRSNFWPKIVSPGFGNRSANVVKSTLALPTTAIRGRFAIIVLFGADTFLLCARLPRR